VNFVILLQSAFIMPPKQSKHAPRGRGASSAASGRVSKSKGTSAAKAQTSNSRAKSSDQIPSDQSDQDPFADDEPRQQRHNNAMEEIDEDGEDDEAQKTIPPELLTRLLHEFFEKDGTRISKDANKAVAKYMDVFVRETIARTAVEKESGFLEVCWFG
jgi:centromere protein X